MMKANAVVVWVGVSAYDLRSYDENEEGWNRGVKENNDARAINSSKRIRMEL